MNGMPSLLSPASPARFWAWVRYFLAPSEGNDLRITTDFADLDPHQKGILSDDFGVAISTQWLFDRLGGFAKILNGRYFMLQYAHLLRTRLEKSKAKVGPSKTPNFAILDQMGKWHVLECKGTQSGRKCRDDFLQKAISQKKMLQIAGNIRREQLAAGLALSNERNRLRTQLRIIDPEAEPLLTLGESDFDTMEKNANRISFANALAAIGLNDIAMEIALPADILSTDDLLRPTEAKRARTSHDIRYSRASQQLKDRSLAPLEFRHRPYEGRSAEFNFPERDQTMSFNTIVVRQGIDRDFLQEITSIGPDLDENLNHLLQARDLKRGIKLFSEGDRVTLTDGDLLFADLVLKRR